MPTVGVLARIEQTSREATARLLDAIEGVETFDVDDADRLGVLIEADTLDAAHEILRSRVDRTDGVLGTWPIYVNVEDVDPASSVIESANGEVARARQLDDRTALTRCVDVPTQLGVDVPTQLGVDASTQLRVDASTQLRVDASTQLGVRTRQPDNRTASTC